MPLHKVAVRRYSQRRLNLEQLGFSNYSAYLESDLWREIRERVFAFYGRQCFGCAAEATQVHHDSYSLIVLQGHDLGKLYQVCRACHEWAEHIGEVKVSPRRATARLKRRRKERGLPENRERRHLTAEEIDRYRTKRGGWDAPSLRKLGVPWPPPKGWRKALLGKASTPTP